MLSSSSYSPSCLLKGNPDDQYVNIAAPHPLNFHGKDLHGAVLHGANFKRCDLSGANLSHAILVDVDFTLANLSGANLSNAKFTNCHFFPDLKYKYLREFNRHLNWYHMMYASDVNLPILKPLIIKDLIARVENSDWSKMSLETAILFLTKMLGHPFSKAPKPDNFLTKVYRFFSGHDRQYDTYTPSQRLIYDAIKRLEKIMALHTYTR